MSSEGANPLRTQTTHGEPQKKRTATRQLEVSLGKITGWFGSRLGLSYPLQKLAPAYAINPFYWLGSLTIVAFVIEGVTGCLMMLYYVPTPTEAFSSTQFIIQNVTYGRFLETVHLYTAYAMIVLAFMHLMRSYFVSAHKKPRELMWIIGMLMGLLTLGFGFTGYLLPWTVVSKSATDVGFGLIDSMPSFLSGFFRAVLMGNSGDETTLLRFYDLHVVILPLILIVLIAIKMFMAAHGTSGPVRGRENLPENKNKLIPIFPDVTLYIMELAAFFGGIILLISALFPITLPPEYSPQLAAQYVAVPDWYFLWIYQILKIQAFERVGVPISLSFVTLIFVVFLILPFIDRSKTRKIGERMKFVTIGSIFASELIGLTVWAELTPGVSIPNEEAALVLGGIALFVTLGSVLCYAALRKCSSLVQKSKSALRASELEPMPSSHILWTAASFAFLLGVCTFTIGGTFDSLVSFAIGGYSPLHLEILLVYLTILAASLSGVAYLIYRIELGAGSLKERIRLLEIG